MRSHIQFSAAKNYFLGFATSGAILLSGLYYFNSQNPTKEPTPAESRLEYISAEQPPLQDFDPNELNADQWQNLGFSERQVATILKYKQVVGGTFNSKAQLKKCYAISPEKFAQLEPYILLPESSTHGYKIFNNYTANYRNFKSNNSSHHQLRIKGKFNPDHLSAEDFVLMGFSEKQANSILKYKNYLGGSFISKEKFKACFMISDEKYRQMEPYLLLPDKFPHDVLAQENFKPTKQKPQIIYHKFDPNSTDLEGWKSLGFSEKQAQVIINYRDRKLRGSFKSLDDIQNCFVISPEKFEELKPFIVLAETNTSTNLFKASFASRPYTNEVSAEAKTDFSKVDLNEITFRQLQEFGFDDKSAAMMLSYRKKLGGFVTKEQIVDTYDIDRILAQRLIYIAPLDVSKVAKYKLADAPEEWLKNHPYFKYSADKIIYYRITNPDDRKIWKYLKLKPEYETRMRLYVRND